jgi:DNA-binding transcriptional LysR family regulator
MIVALRATEMNLASRANLRHARLPKTHKGSRIENLIDGYFNEIRFHPTVFMTFDNAEAIKAMIRTGFGIAMLPYYLIESDLRAGSLRLIRQKEHALISSINLVSRKTSYVPPPTAAFIEIAQEFRSNNPKLCSGKSR